MQRFVMPMATYVAVVALLASCATFDQAPDLCRRAVASGTTSSFLFMRSRSAQFELFRQLASHTREYTTTAAMFPRELWLQAPTGAVVLCRVESKYSKYRADRCGGEWWRFEEVNGMWHVVAHSKMLCMA